MIAGLVDTSTTLASAAHLINTNGDTISSDSASVKGSSSDSDSRHGGVDMARTEELLASAFTTPLAPHAQQELIAYIQQVPLLLSSGGRFTPRKVSSLTSLRYPATSNDHHLLFFFAYLCLYFPLAFKNNKYNIHTATRFSRAQSCCSRGMSHIAD